MTSRNQKILIGLLLVMLVALFLVGTLVGAAVFGWRAAQRAGNEAATLQNLKTVAAVEFQYFNTHNRTFATFDELIKDGMLNAKFAGSRPVADGYVLTLSLTPARAGATPAFSVTADPLNDSSGANHFYLDFASGRIHVNAERRAGPDDPDN